MTTTEKWLVAFLCALLASCMSLGGTLIYLNATRPAYVVDACPTVKP